MSMIISMFFTLSLSASGEPYYGSSPSINRYEGKLNTGYLDQLDSNVMFQLPSSVSPDDELSLIIEMPTVTLLDAYHGTDKTLSFTEYVVTDEANTVRSLIEREAGVLKAKLDGEGITYKFGDSFDTVISGFEIIVKASEFESVCNTVGSAANVIIGDEYEVSKTELVENKVNVYETGIFNSSEFGYDGEGTVVAVLDTGLDYYHSAFSDKTFTSSNKTLTKEDVEKIIGSTRAEEAVPGLTASDVYRSEKVPFSFDYADRDSDVFPLLSNHGTHVAGVIAGNRLEHIESEDYSGEFVGVAPNAQLVIMKIFSDVESTARASRIITALEDCVALGVDVINMSIGTSAGFSRPSDKEMISGVYDKIRDEGISLVVAASNSFNSTYASDKNGNLGLTSNPDSGTVGSPATYLGALSVASINGAKTPYLSYNGSIMYFNESNNRVAKELDFVGELLGEGVNEIEMPYVTIPGAGRTADYTGIDVKGKLVLVKRGYTNFEDKVNIAEEMGAAGIIVYNNVSGDIKMNVGEVNLPSCSISQDDGEVLAAAKTGVIKISRSQESGPFISDFSSWGPTPDLKIKPEITAHGGMILSAVPGESYDRISGTSMACPNIAGAAAIIRQYVKENPQYFGENIQNDPQAVTKAVNRLMMSTADIILNKNGLPYAVRKQGAGLANLTNTKATTAYILTYNLIKDENGNKVYDLDNPMEKPKIELGDDPEKSGVYELVFSVENFGTSDLSYDLGAYVLTEGVSDTKTAQGNTTVTETAYSLDGASVVINSVEGGTKDGNRIFVAGKSTATVSVTITLSEADKKYLDDSFENGMYVEGFITLDAEGETVDLNVPYLAFYGDWTKAPLFDLDYFETDKDERDELKDPADKTLPDAVSTRPVGGSTGDYMSYLGSYYFIQDPSKADIAADRKYISISNQESSINSLKYVWAGMLRSAEKVEITITEDATGEVVFTRIDEYVRKSYGDGGPIRPANIDIDFSAIDQNLKNNTAYTVKLKAYLDYGDGGVDTNLNNEFSFPLVTDFEAPSITDCEFYTEYDRSTKKTRLFAKIAVYDNHYAMALQIGCYNGTDTSTSFDKYYTPVYSSFNSTNYVVYELTDHIDEILRTNNEMKTANIKHNDDITFSVICYDYALNISAFEIALPTDYTDFFFEEEEITISPNETYLLNPIVYPGSEWNELITYTSSNKNVCRIVGNKIIGLKSGYSKITATYTGTDDNGKPVRLEAQVSVHVLAPEDVGYKKYDRPVTDNFNVTGYYVDKAFYQLASEDRELGLTGSEMKFAGLYSLSMYPSEAVTLRYELEAYFPEDTTVVYETGNSKIVTVDKNGKITAVAEGISSITIKVMIKNQKGEYVGTYYSKSIDIEVKDPYVTSGPSLTHYYGTGVNGVIDISRDIGITEIGQFAFSNFDYVMKGENDEISEELPETMKMWYIGDNTITEVTIPEGVERIGAYAFANLTALKKINLPSTLEYIEYGAFIGCTSLETVNGLENVKFINQGAFEQCALKGDLRLDSAVAIADRAFANNKSITSVTLSESIQSVGGYAFAGNSALKSITIKADIIKLGKYAFTDCKSLTSARINASVIPEGAFNNCTSLSAFTIGKDVDVISQYAFMNTSIEKFGIEANNKVLNNTSEKITTDHIISGTTLVLVAPKVSGTFVNNTVTTVASCAFSGNVSIEAVVLPSVTVVERFAFSECASLKSVTLSPALSSIGEYAFERTALDSYLPFENVKSIGDYAFCETKLTSVTIPHGAVIGEGAFKNCNEITEIYIGDNVEIGREAFALDRNNFEIKSDYRDENKKNPYYYYVYVSKLAALEIGDNALIGEKAFLCASDITEIKLGAGAVIGDEAFANNTKLERIDLSAVKSIGVRAFSGYILFEYVDPDCTVFDYDENGNQKIRFNSAKLTAVDLSSAAEIGEEAFSYCTSLESVILNADLENIPTNTFAGCSALALVENLDKVEEIGDYAFAGTALTDIDLSSAVIIGKYSFSQSETVSSVKLGEGVEIGEGAFAECPALVTLTGEEKALSIGDFAFANTGISEADLSSAEYIGALAFVKPLLTPFKVTLGDSLKNMGDNPFAYCELEPFSAMVKDPEPFNGKEYETLTYTYDISESIKAIDGSLYRVVPAGLELITWCGADSAVIAEGTVRLSEMSFAGTSVKSVVLPYELRAIGSKAFFDCRNLTVVTFKGINAPILEEEYDYEYFFNCYLNDVVSSLGDYSVVGSDKNTAGYEIIYVGGGLGIIPFKTYDFIINPANVFYGANFVDRIGHIDEPLTMIRPANGKNYDSFIFGQYFNLTVDGKAAPDDITLAAIEALKTLPENANMIKLSDKALVQSVRAAYDKIAGDEQRGLVPQSLVALLKACEQMISDLEYLQGGSNTPAPELPVEDEEKTPVILIVLTVVVVILALAIIALIVFFILLIKKMKNIGLFTPGTGNSGNGDMGGYVGESPEDDDGIDIEEETPKEAEEESAEEVSAENFKRTVTKPVDFDDITEGYLPTKSSILKKKIIIASCSALAAAALVTGVIFAVINASKTFYSDYEKDGYTVSIAFDSSGGSFKGSNSSIVDLYKPESIGEDGIKLLAPDDERRDKNNVMTLTKPGYFLAGWYKERALIDENDPSKGYTYSGKWDFENDKFYLDSDKKYSAEENALTLYAAWVPYYSFEIHYKDTDGSDKILESVSALELNIPEWVSGKVTLTMGNFPVRDGFTLIPESVKLMNADGSLTDLETFTDQSGSKKFITGEWDVATATSKTPVIKLFTEWEEGKIYRIYSVDDLIKNVDLNGYYEIYDHLNFSDAQWPAAFTNGAFNGKFYGKDGNYIVSNINITANALNRSIGLFGELGENASVESLYFKNINLTVDLMSAKNDSASIGLLAGSANEGASFKNVKIGGSLIFTDNCSSLAGKDDIIIKKVVGNGDKGGIGSSEITVTKKNPDNTSFALVLDGDTITVVSEAQAG